MFKAQFKRHSPFESWTTSGTYTSEQTAISVALRKKTAGAILVRVVNKQGHVVYSG